MKSGETEANSLYRLRYRQQAFTLIEALTVLIIASMLMIAAVEVYSHVRGTADRLHAELSKGLVCTEVLQRIAEDLDRIALPGFDTSVTVLNKTKNGYNVSQLTILSRYYGDGTRPQVYEKVVWQTDYDPMTDTLILYRAHQGLRLDDPLLDMDATGQPRDDVQRFVPVADGITYFEVLVPSGENLVNAWTQTRLPNAVMVSMSTALPVQNELGEWVIPEEAIYTRTIAVDRTRQLRFRFAKQDLDLSALGANDPNQFEPLAPTGTGESGDDMGADAGNASRTSTPDAGTPGESTGDISGGRP